MRSGAEWCAIAGAVAPAAVGELIAGVGEALDRLFAPIDRFRAGDREAGVQPEPIEVGLLLESVRLHFAVTDQDGRLNISIADRSLRLFADPEMLGTAIINLVDNALKYSDRPIR